MHQVGHHLVGQARRRATDVNQIALQPRAGRAPQRRSAARPSGVAKSMPGRLARNPSSSRSTKARNSAAISTTVSNDGQLSHTRSSTVGVATPGRTSKYTMPASAITPVAIRSATSLSEAAAVVTGAQRPVVGQRCHTRVRTLA